jgi:hypothetical protein
VVQGFHSFHWTGCRLDAGELREAHVELMNPSGAEPYLRAFRTLLDSGNPVAVGIALDHFQYSDALTRFGGTSLYARYERQVLSVARAVQRQPPIDAGDAAAFPGANHASALNAMMNLARAGDADLIADALAMATDLNVRDAAYLAAGTALADSPEPSPRLVAMLGTVVFDDRLDVRYERSPAVGALFEADSPAATDILVRATELPELELQVEAALGLTMPIRLAAHRERLLRLVASWPDDAGYRADEVRDALAEGSG